MGRYSLSLGRAFGIRITVDPSWFFIFGLVTWTLAVRTFAPEFDNWNAVEYWAAGALTALLFFVSVLLHEFGHSAAALRFKLPVRRVTLMMFGGVAEIGSQPPNPSTQFWVALAGPAVNVVLWVFFSAVQSLEGRPGLMMAAGYLAHINLILAAFNLIPGFPLDGGRVLQAILWRTTRNLARATIVVAQIGRWTGLATMAAGAWELAAGNPFGGLWVTVSGWFLFASAADQLRQPAPYDPAATDPLTHAMSCRCTSIPGDISLQDLAESRAASGAAPCFTIMAGEQIAGVLTLNRIKETPRRAWQRTSAGEVMIPLADFGAEASETTLRVALEEMDRRGVDRLPVRADDQVIGMLEREDVAGYLERLQRERRRSQTV